MKPKIDAKNVVNNFLKVYRETPTDGLMEIPMPRDTAYFPYGQETEPEIQEAGPDELPTEPEVGEEPPIIF